jgi:hypothetical protein
LFFFRRGKERGDMRNREVWNETKTRSSEVRAACFALSSAKEFPQGSKFTPFCDLAHGLWLFLQLVLGFLIFVELILHVPILGPWY